MIETLFHFAAIALSINVAAIEESKKQFTPLYFVSPFLAPPDGKCAPILKECDPDYIFYTDDGSCNNLKHSYFGQAMHPFERWLPANYADGIDQPRVSVTGNPLQNSRRLRTTLLPNAEYRDSDERNALFYAFGQYSSHDPSEHRPLVSKENCCNNGKPADPMPYECLPTIMPADDEFYSQFGVTCVQFERSTNTRYMGCKLEPIRQINLETAYLDLSILYGSSKERADATRALTGGLLKAENDAENSFQEYPTRRTGRENCPYGGLGGLYVEPEELRCFYSGDDRTNQNPEIFSMNIVFFRCHNFMARRLMEINPHWDDQKLYLFARRITVAMYQNIFFFEYVRVLIGVDAALKYNLLTLAHGYNNGYNPDISPQTFHEYTTTVGRSGHSTIRGSFKYGGQVKLPTSYRLRDTYFKLELFLQKNVFLNILQAYAFDQCSEQDKFLSEEINNYLFVVPEMTHGGDLSALGIDRGREFGIQSYNNYRKLCGIPALTSFEDLAADIAYPEDIEKLKSLYESHEDIDLYVAGFMEKPYHGSMVGPTFTCLLGAQFQHWKYADRKYFEFPSAKFTWNQLKEIRSSFFAQIICIANPEMEWIPQCAFYTETKWNPAVRCKDIIQQIDLTAWRDDQ